MIDSESTSQPFDARRLEVVDDRIAEVLRAKSTAQRVEMMLAANRTMRLLIKAGVTRIHPDWTDEQVKSEVARRMLGEDRMTFDGTV